jgi:predicted ester cyclase
MNNRTFLWMAAWAVVAACSNGSSTENKAAMDQSAKEAANKAAYEKLMNGWASGDKAVFEEMLADNFVTHNPDPMIKSTGKQNWLDALAMYHAANPDMKAEMKQIVADGDWVSSSAMIRGTNTGDMGPGMPATNKAWEATSMDMIRFENGKAVEHWGVFDNTTMMAQLGMIPEPGGSMAMEKEHVCNPGCKGDKHNYLHGEKGHVCSPDCPMMKDMHDKKM